jgi:hypothetical protein
MLEFLMACGFKGDTPEGAGKKEPMRGNEQPSD